MKNKLRCASTHMPIRIGASFSTDYKKTPALPAPELSDGLSQLQMIFSVSLSKTCTLFGFSANRIVSPT